MRRLSSCACGQMQAVLGLMKWAHQLARSRTTTSPDQAPALAHLSGVHSWPEQHQAAIHQVHEASQEVPRPANGSCCAPRIFSVRDDWEQMLTATQLP